MMNYATAPSAIVEVSTAWWNWGFLIIRVAPIAKDLRLMETDREPEGPDGGVDSENLFNSNDIRQR